MITRIFITLSLFGFCCILGKTQTPLIQKIDKDHSAWGETVTLKGNGFGSNKADLVVMFGGAKGVVLTATDHIVEVEAPAGATYDNIVLVKKASAASGFSSTNFFLSFSSVTAGFASTDFGTQTNFSTKPSSSATSNLYDVCMGDFNNDGKNDIAVANSSVNYISVFLNTSTLGNASFTRSDYNLSARTIHIACGDVDNDGNFDLMATEDGTASRFFVLKGNGSGTFGTPVALPIDQSLIRHIQFADIDLNGKSDVILSNKLTNEIIILKNTSSGSTISFASPVRVVIPPIKSSDGTDALQVKDLDNDNAPDIIVSPTQSAHVYVLRNKSTAGNFQFDDPIMLQVPGAITGLKVGDLDKDGKAEIAVTKLAGTTMSILKNTSVSGAITFQNALNVDVELSGSWGLDLGDLNGDGLPDLVIPHISSTTTAAPIKSKLTVLENKGNLVFQKIAIDKDEVSRYVKIADVDGDAKPDITGASVDFFISGQGNAIASNMFVILNKRCFQPKINPEGPINVCNSDPVKLTSIKGVGVAYQWQKDNVNIAGETSSNLTIAGATDGNYKLRVTAANCPVVESGEVHVKITTAENTVTDPVVVNPAPGCTGPNASITLDATATGDVLKYKWEGPGFSPAISTDGIATIGGSGKGLTLANAGYYNVSYLGSGDCVIKSERVLVDIIDVPEFTTSSSNGSIICADGTTTLSLFPSTSGYSYQWMIKNPDNTSNPTGTSDIPLSVSEAGTYFARVSVPGASCIIDSKEIVIAEKAVLKASFDVPSTACTTQALEFNNTTPEPETLSYKWLFGDNSSSSEKSPKHTYQAPSTYGVKLIAQYADGSCASEATKSVKILAAPPLEIVTSNGTDNICESGSTKLSVSGTTIESYQWSTGETTESILAKSGKTYSVTIRNSSGCILKTEKTFSFFPDTPITVTAEPPSGEPGKPVQLTVEGLSSVQWTPANNLSDPLSTTPIALVDVTTTYIVTGKDANECLKTDSITVQIAKGAIVNFLKPRNFFSPNTDSVDDFWSINNIESFPGCGVAVYDEKGVKVFESKPYNNDWNGTFNGTTLPDGVYYFIIRCDGEENLPKTGSITLLR
jgi:gliding motility-associated-like protein